MTEKSSQQPSPQKRQVASLLLSDSTNRAKRVRRWFSFQIFARTANIVMLAVVAVFGFIIWRSMPFLTSGGMDRLAEVFTSGNWHPDSEPPEFGMLSLFYGSFIVTVLAMLIAGPIGILSAVTLSDMVPFRVRQFLKPFIELLAAIPSVVFGFFAIKIVAPWLQETFGLASGTNALNAAIILAIMAVPTIVSVAEDAVSSLGRERREASYALGATRAETLMKVILPAAWNGIAAALILGTMRAVGETMVVWMAAGNAANMPDAWYRVDQVILGLGDAVRTMTATIAGDIGEAPAESLHRSALFTVGLLLLLFTFGMNLLTDYLATKQTAHHQTAKKTSILPRAFQGFYEKFVGLLSILSPVSILGQKFLKPFRKGVDKGFSLCAYASIALLFTALTAVLLPIFRAGSEAFLFKETVEHRLFLWEHFHRGSREAVQKEFRECYAAREPIYRQLDALSWLTPEIWIDEANKISRAAGSVTENRPLLRAVRRLCEANTQTDFFAAWRRIETLRDESAETSSSAHPLFELAQRYYDTAKEADLSLREQLLPLNQDVTYTAAFKQIRTLITGEEGTGSILGPDVPEWKRRESIKHLPPEVRYGPAHWSMALSYLSQLKSATIWEKRYDKDGNVLPCEKRRIDRVTLFEETALYEPVRRVITDLEQNLASMHNPRWTFYGRYFLDSSTAGHYLGGVGPELLGTTAIALFAILFALPLGIVTAAYLVEVAKENRMTRLLRLCVSTLAGIPSIVFGLFGLAIIVELITGTPCLLAGAITLAILILPVIIRTSEEAIRSVPQTYREAAVGLGAGPVWTFISVTLPASLPGILTGTILGISRAAGETAPLLFTCAVASGSFLYGTGFLLQPTPILSYAAYDMAVGDRLAKMVPYNQFGLVATLIVFVLLLNLIAILLRGRIASKLRGT